MSGQLQQLLDQFEIQQLLAAYCRGADRLEPELLKSVYWEDATDDHGTMKGNAQMYAEGMRDRLPGIYSTVFHHLGQTYFQELTATRAVAETYFVATKRAADLISKGHVTYGRYLDVFEKREGRWKIFNRQVIYDLCVPMSPEVAFLPGQVTGRPWPEDSSYELLAAKRC